VFRRGYLTFICVLLVWNLELVKSFFNTVPFLGNEVNNT
jgi:hypothetical protein